MIHTHRFWLAVVFVTAMAAAAFAFAQPLAEPAGPASTGEPLLTTEQREQLRERFHHRRGRMELRQHGLELVDSVYEVSTDPARAAIMHMQRIERIYKEQRDREGLRAFYESILDRTDNLAVRNVAWLKLSELMTHAKDTQGALALLEQGLEENLRQAD